MFRRPAKIQMLRNGAKHLEAKVFQPGHVLIIHGTAGRADDYSYLNATIGSTRVARRAGM